MVSVQPSRLSPDKIDVVITFRTNSSDIVFLSADVTNWTPEQMSWNGESHEHVITVPRGTPAILYKFRIGENNWFHDGTVSAEPDGFFGWNNKFEIPEVPLPNSPNDVEEEMDLESVAAVESIADTVSEFGTEGDTHSLFHDEELIDRDETEKVKEAKQAEEKSPTPLPMRESTPKPTQQHESTVSGAHGAAEAGACAAETTKTPSRFLFPISAIGILGLSLFWVWWK